METKVLGKIGSVSFGYGGYQDAMFGLGLSLETTSGGTYTFIDGGWSLLVDHTKHCKWTEEDRDKKRAAMVKRVNEIMQDAKVTDVMQLRGKPIEVIWEHNMLKSWRILKEVL